MMMMTMTMMMMMMMMMMAMMMTMSMATYICKLDTNTTTVDLKGQQHGGAELNIQPSELDLLAMEVFKNIYVQIVDIVYLHKETCKCKRYTLISQMLDGESLLPYIEKNVNAPAQYSPFFIEYVYQQIAEKFDSVFPGLIYLKKSNGDVFIAW